MLTGNRSLCYSSYSAYIKGYTIKSTVSVGTKAPSLVISIITKYSNKGVTAYFSMDIGMKINYVTMAGVAAATAAVCVAVPYISPVVAKVYGSIIATIASYNAFVSVLPGLVAAGVALAK